MFPNANYDLSILCLKPQIMKIDMHHAGFALRSGLDKGFLPLFLGHCCHCWTPLLLLLDGS